MDMLLTNLILALYGTIAKVSSVLQCNYLLDYRFKWLGFEICFLFYVLGRYQLIIDVNLGFPHSIYNREA